MKTAQKTVYIAFDDAEFLDEERCRAHEENHWLMRFVGLSLEQIEAAMERKDTDLADAFERAGQRIASARRESGELRRASPKRDVIGGKPWKEGDSLSPPMSDAEVDRTIAEAECGG